MATRKALRIASRIKFLLGQLIQHELNDPRLGFVTVLEVDVSDDIAEARVQISVLGSDADRTKALCALEAARGFLQKQVGKRLETRTIPALSFELDESVTRMERIEELLREARRKDAQTPEAQGDSI